jgi:hypothetical protein
VNKTAIKTKVYRQRALRKEISTIMSAIKNAGCNVRVLKVRWRNVGLFLCVLVVLVRCQDSNLVEDETSVAESTAAAAAVVDADGPSATAAETSASSATSVTSSQTDDSAAVTLENYFMEAHINATYVSSITSPRQSGPTPPPNPTHKAAATTRGADDAAWRPEGKTRMRKDACVRLHRQGNRALFPVCYLSFYYVWGDARSRLSGELSSWQLHMVVLSLMVSCLLSRLYRQCLTNTNTC